jgi:hypothetical protein
MAEVALGPGKRGNQRSWYQDGDSPVPPEQFRSTNACLLNVGSARRRMLKIRKITRVESLGFSNGLNVTAFVDIREQEIPFGLGARARSYRLNRTIVDTATDSLSFQRSPQFLLLFSHRRESHKDGAIPSHSYGTNSHVTSHIQNLCPGFSAICRSKHTYH